MSKLSVTTPLTHLDPAIILEQPHELPDRHSHADKDTQEPANRGRSSFPLAPSLIATRHPTGFRRGLLVSAHFLRMPNDPGSSLGDG